MAREAGQISVSAESRNPKTSRGRNINVDTPIAGHVLFFLAFVALFVAAGGSGGRGRGRRPRLGGKERAAQGGGEKEKSRRYVAFSVKRARASSRRTLVGEGEGN